MTPSSPAPSAAARWTAADWVTLAALLLLAAALRLPTLGRWSVWMDEALTIHDAFVPPGAPAGAVPGYESEYPLNYWLTHLALGWWGRGETSVRLLPCLAGIASVGALFASVRRYTGRAAAALAGLFLATSAWHIYWSQNARHYAPMVLFSLVAAFAAFRAVHDRRPAWVLPAVGAFILASLSHPTTAALAGAVGLLVVWHVALAMRTWSARMRLLAGGGVGLALAGCLWWFVPIVRYAYQLKQGGNPGYFLASAVQYLEIPLLLAAGAGAILAWQRERAWAVFVASYAALPLAAMTVLSAGMTVSSPYVFVILPAVCVLAGQAVAELGRPPRGRPLAALLVAATVLAHQAGETYLYFTYRHGDRPRWREAAAFLERARVPHDRLATNGEPALAYHLGYAPHTLRDPAPIHTLDSWQPDPIFDQPGPLWVVVRGSRLATPQGDRKFRDWLERRGVCVAEFPAWTNVKDRTIRIYRTASDAAADRAPPSAPSGT